MTADEAAARQSMERNGFSGTVQVDRRPDRRSTLFHFAVEIPDDVLEDRSVATVWAGVQRQLESGTTLSGKLGQFADFLTTVTRVMAGRREQREHDRRIEEAAEKERIKRAADRGTMVTQRRRKLELG